MPQKPNQKIFAYLLKCFQEDNRTKIIRNLFSDKKISSKIFLDGAEVLSNEFLEKYTFNNFQEAVNLQNAYYVSRKEKELIYANIFLGFNTTNSEGTVENIFSPLFYYKSEIAIENDIASLNFKSKFEINFELISILLDAKSANELYESLQELLSLEHSDEEFRLLIVAVLSEYFSKLDADLFRNYPKFSKESDVKKKLNEVNENILIANLGVICLVDKSKSARDLQEEIEDLAYMKSFSRPLDAIYLEKFYEKEKKKKKNFSFIPAILTKAQQKILSIANDSDVSLLIGPPGTGKSFTIASLAVEYMCKDQSVLIVSKNDEAVDVVHEKILNFTEDDNLLVRNGSGDQLKKIKMRIDNLVSAIIAETNQGLNVKKLKREIERINDEIDTLVETIDRKTSIEMSRGEFLGDAISSKDKSTWNKFKHRYIKFQTDFTTPLWNLTQKLEELQKLKEKKIRVLIKELSYDRYTKALSLYKKEFISLLKALKTRDSLKQETYIKNANFNSILEIFPIWLSNTFDVGKFLPLQAELFDILIIDEASQCDIASVIPAIFRAKKIVLVGDPNQLRHLSFLSRSRQNAIGMELDMKFEEIDKFNYRDLSILDVVRFNENLKDNIVFLDEHYRSEPEIIQFSNEEIYSNALKIMSMRPNSYETKSLDLVYCSGGYRDKNGINTVEVDKIIQKLKEIVEEEKDLEFKSSVGILSPFRNQTDYIRKQIITEFKNGEILSHNILVGTPYSFQGNEKDIMLISFTVDDASHLSIFNYLDKAEVMNVAITRARKLQLIFTSIDPKIYDPENPTIYSRYIQYILNLSFSIHNDSKFHDDFQENVYTEINRSDLKIYKNFKIADMLVDIVIEYRGGFYAVDLIGYPGATKFKLPTEKYLILSRNKIPVFPLPYSLWKVNKKLVLVELERFLKGETRNKK